MKNFSITQVILMAALLGLSMVICRPLRAAPPISAEPPLAELLEEGLTQNKELQSLQAQVESLEKKISVAGSLEDPRLGFGLVNVPTDTWELDQEPMTKQEVFIAQRFPWFGTLSLKSQGQALKASQKKALLEAKKLELARKIATAYYRLGFVATNLEINTRLTDMVTQLLTVAETRYASGEGLQQDVLQAQVELSELIDERIDLKKRSRILKNQINELLNRESFMAVLPPIDLKYPDARLDVEDLKKQSLNNNPWLRVRLAEVEQTLVEKKLAKKDYWPDMDFKVAYGRREEDFNGRSLPDLFSATVTITVPLWFQSRQNKQLASSEKSHEAARKYYRNLVKSLPHRVDALATEIRDTQENYRLYMDALLVQSEQWARSSLTAYEVGKVEFNTMVNAQIRLLRVELQAKRYLYTIYQKLAELEEVLGGPLHPQAEDGNQS